MLRREGIDRFLERRVAALGLLATLLVAWHLDYLTAPTALWDEKMYLDAAALYVGGSTPYAHQYYNYPPTLAQVIATAQRGGWEWPLVLAWRALNLAAVVGLSWLAASRTRWRGSARLLGGLAVGLSPVVGQALRFGNLSPLVSFAALAAILAERRRPAASAIGLGGGIAIKPLALAGGAFLTAHRILAGPRGRSRIAALGWPLVTAAAVAPGAALLPGMFDRMSFSYFDAHHFSLRRLVQGLGFDVSAIWFAAAIVLGALVVAGRRPLGTQELFRVVPVVSLLALPIVWAHSFALVLPLQLEAVARMLGRVRSSPAASLGRRQLLEVLLVVGSLFAIQGAAAPELVNHWAFRTQIVVCLFPMLAPLALLIYVQATEPRAAAEAARRIRDRPTDRGRRGRILRSGGAEPYRRRDRERSTGGQEGSSPPGETTS